MLSVILPSRGRPESLLRAVTSLARDPSRVEVLVGLDDDDETRGEALALVSDIPGVRVLVGPRMMCQAAYYNYLSTQAKHDWVGIFADDYTVDQPDWAEIMETTLAALPNGYGFGYFHDPMYPFFSTFPFMSRSKTMALQIDGKFLPEFFPFLFGDTWLNEIGVMATFILPSKASIKIQKETGHIHKFRDLRMWSEFFHETRPLRAQIAEKMIRCATMGHPYGDQLVASMPERTQLVDDLFRKSSMTEEFFNRMEQAGWEGRYVHPDYEAMKKRTEQFLNRRDAA